MDVENEGKTANEESKIIYYSWNEFFDSKREDALELDVDYITMTMHQILFNAFIIITPSSSYNYLLAC